MAWEKRGKGLYYYRKYRDGSKVISEYVGAGAVGEMVEKLDLEERRQKDQKAKQEREQIEAMREYFDSIEGIMEPVEEEIKALTKAYYLVNDYHTHKGQWRKKRHGRRE